MVWLANVPGPKHDINAILHGLPFMTLWLYMVVWRCSSLYNALGNFSKTPRFHIPTVRAASLAKVETVRAIYLACCKDGWTDLSTREWGISTTNTASRSTAVKSKTGVSGSGIVKPSQQFFFSFHLSALAGIPVGFVPCQNFGNLQSYQHAVATSLAVGPIICLFPESIVNRASINIIYIYYIWYILYMLYILYIYVIYIFIYIMYILCIYSM